MYDCPCKNGSRPQILHTHCGDTFNRQCNTHCPGCIFAGCHYCRYCLYLVHPVVAIVITRISNGQRRSFERKRRSSEDQGAAPLKTSFSVNLFAVPALFGLTVSYADQLAVVARQLGSNTPISITAAFSDDYGHVDPSRSTSNTASSRTISILTFTQQLAAILSTFVLTGAVWLHSNYLASHGTNVS